MFLKNLAMSHLEDLIDDMLYLGTPNTNNSNDTELWSAFKIRVQTVFDSCKSHKDLLNQPQKVQILFLG